MVRPAQRQPIGLAALGGHGKLKALTARQQIPINQIPITNAIQPAQNLGILRSSLSAMALLTGLANDVQPIIRYDIGDRPTFYPDPCSCGSPFAVVSE